MEINKLFKILIVTFFLLSCKENPKKDNITTDSSIMKTVIEESTTKSTSYNLVKDFYTAYLTYLNENSEDFEIDNYLSDKLIEKINNADYNVIITGQDHGKFDLNTLKVTKTSKSEIFKVEFVDLGYDVIVYPKVELINNGYKIIDITRSLDQIEEPILSKEIKTDKFTYYAFDYIINPGDHINETSYIIEYLEEEYIVFSMMGYEGNFDYKCRQVRTKEGVSLYYVEAENDGEEYTGNKNKPIVKIYKRDNNFYAKSLLIENGKEVKLKEVESRY